MPPRLVLVALCAALAAAPLFPAQLTVAVAANAQFAADDLLAAFRRAHDVEVRTIIGASGTFASQVMNGAPIDLFLSADMDYPEKLAAAGFVIDGPRAYAYGLLVLWTTRDIDLASGLGVLVSPRVRTIAVANPAVAPYGVEALAALEKAGILDRVRAKIVYGESIAQVNSYVLSGAADAGITARSIVLSPAMKTTGRWIAIDPALYHPIAQGAVVLRAAGGDPDRREAARSLFDFLFSAPARAILQSYGYLTP